MDCEVRETAGEREREKRDKDRENHLPKIQYAVLQSLLQWRQVRKVDGRFVLRQDRHLALARYETKAQRRK
jgi:hypothetical protein